MSILIENPGFLTLIEDLGRWGYQRYGVCPSGVMDARAAQIANLLVDNDPGEAVLECTVLGPQIRFRQDAVIAMTGGSFSPRLDDLPLSMYEAHKICAGQTLRLGAAKAGCRAYLAFAGGIAVPPVMNSRSTDLKAGLGALGGRSLQKGDTLALLPLQTELKNMGRRKISPEFVPRACYTLRVVPGPQDSAFTETGRKTFFGSTYTVGNQSDRMGCRLEGPEVGHCSGADIVSDGIVFGAIQIPNSGQPIIMTADHQTTGGYTKMATVITADFRILAQLRPQDQIRFEAVSMDAAQDALLCQREALRALRSMIRGR